jgi:hypothetical protein
VLKFKRKFQRQRVNGLIYEGIFTNICSFFPTTNFPIMIVPTQVAFQARTPMYVLKKAQIRAITLRCAKVSQPDSFVLFENSAISFAPDLKRLTDLLCMGPNTSLRTQVPYKLNGFPF